MANPGDGAGALWCSGAGVGGMDDRRDLLPLRAGAAAADGAVLGAWAGADMGTVAERDADDSNDLLVLCIGVASVCKRRPAETGDSLSVSGIPCCGKSGSKAAAATAIQITLELPADMKGPASLSCWCRNIRGC